MSLKLNSSGTISVKNIGKDSLTDGLAVAVRLTAKKTTNGITYLFTATENTIRDLRSVLGPVVSVSKPARTKFCTFESTLGYDLNKHALSTSFTANRKWQGKEVELKAAWAEQLGQWVLGALIKPHARHKLAGTVNPHTGTSTATYTLDWDGWTFQPALNVRRRAPAFSLSKKLPQARGTVKGTYALQGGAASLQWSRKPATVTVSTRVSGSSIAHPTLTLTLEREYVSLPSKPAQKPAPPTEQPAQPAKKPVEAREKPAAPAPAPAESLEEKIKRLDAAYDAEFARLGARQINGIETLSYKR